MRFKFPLPIIIGIGILGWIIAIGLSLNEWTTLRQIYLLILFGIGVIAPISIELVAKDYPYNPPLPDVALMFQPLVVMASVIAVFSDGALGWLSLLWLAQSGLIALIGLRQWLADLRMPFTSLEEFCLTIGLMYTAISGVWFFASRSFDSFLGFEGVIIPLTAAHFTFIGLGALVNAGMIGRLIRQHVPDYFSWYRIGAWGAILSPALVAIGITITNFSDRVSPIEVIAVIWLAASYVFMASLYLLVVRPTITMPLPKNILSVAVMTLFLTMGLALAYSIGRVTDWWFLSIADMVMWHAWFNAIAFTGLSLVGWFTLLRTTGT